MGHRDVSSHPQGEEHRDFVRRLLGDLRALEKLIADGLIEEGVRRIGAEQELFLTDMSGRPASIAMEVLDSIEDPHFTTELARFNLEINLDPLDLGGDCLSRLERDLDRLIGKARDAARKCGGEVVMAGILPSLRKSDMGLENMTPLPRYYALNRSVNQIRGRPMEFHIKGVDELRVTHDSVMLEACNASFQVHLQVGAGEFARLYNAAQAYAAPVLAAAANSPLLFGKRLWHETRIALFQQAVDTRGSGGDERLADSRVQFGRRWVRESVTEIFREDIARFRAMLAMEMDENPMEKIRAGLAPSLKALCLHNGTVWRWTRPCYGVTGDRPHLRIENRLLPSGPTIVDQISNAAFWLGLMAHAAEEEIDFSEMMEFETVQENFMAAARLGLNAQFTWKDDEPVPAQRLICEELIPLARAGLRTAGVDPGDADRHLGSLAERVSAGRTGSRWLLASLAGMKSHGTASERLSALTRATVARQQDGAPVHEWNLGELSESGGWKRHYLNVQQYMTTDIFTVREDASVELVANMMDWEKIRHVPVEDEQHRLVGLISYRSLLRLLAKGDLDLHDPSVSVAAIMKRDPLTVTPETETIEAIELMRKNSISCLPVVKEGRLVGVVTERDFTVLTRELLIQKLKE